jgi:hypothetical protein
VPFDMYQRPMNCAVASRHSVPSGGLTEVDMVAVIASDPLFCFFIRISLALCGKSVCFKTHAPGAHHSLKLWN